MTATLTEEQMKQQREIYFDLGRDEFLSLDQYLGSAQAFSDSEN